MKLSDCETGERVQVMWYGGANMDCVVVETSEGKAVARESDYNSIGTSTPLRLGDKDILKEPRPQGTHFRDAAREEPWA